MLRCFSLIPAATLALASCSTYAEGAQVGDQIYLITPRGGIGSIILRCTPEPDHDLQCKNVNITVKE